MSLETGRSLPKVTLLMPMNTSGRMTTTIRLNAPTGTDNVLITRETDRCDPAVEFFAGTSIRAEDLNANQEQTPDVDSGDG